MSDLVVFLRARLDEKETVARLRSEWPRWFVHDVDVYDTQDRSGEHLASCRSPAVAMHIASHDPSRVLRDVEAKRRIVDECSTDVSYEEEGMANTILALLALPYSDHADYDQQWRP